MQQLVDKALGFDRKKFNEIEEKLKTIADNKKLTPEERAEQSKPLNEPARGDAQGGDGSPDRQEELIHR